MSGMYTEYSCPKCGISFGQSKVGRCPQCGVIFGRGVSETTEEARRAKERYYRKHSPVARRRREKRKELLDKVGMVVIPVLLLACVAAAGWVAAKYVVPILWPDASRALAGWIGVGVGVVIVAFVIWLCVAAYSIEEILARNSGDHARAERLRVESRVRVQKGLWLAGLMVVGFAAGALVTPHLLDGDVALAGGIVGLGSGLLAWLMVRRLIQKRLQTALSRIG